MKCTACGHENPEGARFCNGCGQSLPPHCPVCRIENPTGSRFCNQCGTELGVGSRVPGAGSDTRQLTPGTPKHLANKILQSKSALEGERKQVTVLFADVKGSMELAEQMDPEQWSQIMQRLFAILAEGVQRFEGFVDKFTGDGIMALFGAPIAHEDHAQRACYVALQLRDAVKTYSDQLRLSRGIDLAIRVGINTGEVVVGTIGDDLRMEYTAQGHTVGLAARLQSLAPPGGACVSEATAGLVSGYVELRDTSAPQSSRARARPCVSSSSRESGRSGLVLIGRVPAG